MMAKRARLTLAMTLLLGACSPQIIDEGGIPVPDPQEALAAQGIVTGTVAMRRLTRSQYRQSVWDALGEDIEIAGQLEPDLRREGLLAVGTSQATVTPLGFEQYESMAYRIAEQALDPARRERLVPCTPTAAEGADDDCAGVFVSELGRRLFRRALREAELTQRVALAREAAEALDDFYAGLEFALASLLTSPNFLFRVPSTSVDEHGAPRLDADALASRLSYALWNTAPDEELLAAASSGALLSAEGLAEQISRMIASERLVDGLRALFSDILAFDGLDDGFRKDGELFPAYNGNLIADAREETLMTIADHLGSGRDYRELFTSKRTFLTRQLATLYGVPHTASEGFEAYEFDEESPRSGLLTHASLLALYSHPGRSSPTLRGEFVRAAFLCQHIPPPPGDVDFSLIEEPSEELPTLRDKVEMHMSAPACAGCHTMTDPIGLALEQFDAIGAYRTEENGALIDPSGQLDGVEYPDAVGLGAALSAHPELSPCLVSHAFKMVVGRDASDEEAPEIARLEEVFAASNYSLPVLLSAILGSPSVRWTTGPEGGAL